MIKDEIEQFFKLEINKLKDKGIYKEALTKDDVQKKFHFTRILDLTSWDILNLANDKKIKREIMQSIQHYGYGQFSTWLLGGATKNHLFACQRIAQFMNKESSLLFPSKNQAIFTLLTTVLNEGDTIYIDSLCQSPVADLAYLIGAETKVVNFYFNDGKKEFFPNVDIISTGRKFAFIETVNALLGRHLPLGDIIKEADKKDIGIIIDDSVALGWKGIRGIGALEEFFPVKSNNIIALTGDFRILGMPIGFIAGSSLLINYIINISKTILKDPSQTALDATILAYLLDKIELKVEERNKLKEILIYIYKEIENIVSRQRVLSNNTSPIISIKFPRYLTAKSVEQHLLKQGILTGAFSVSDYLSQYGVLRTIFHIGVSERGIKNFLEIINNVFKKI